MNTRPILIITMNTSNNNFANDYQNTENNNITQGNVIDVEYANNAISLIKLDDMLAKYMPGNDKMYNIESLAADSMTMMQYIDKLAEDVVIHAKYDRCRQRNLQSEVTIARQQQLGGSTLYDNTLTNIGIKAVSTFETMAVTGKVWGFNNAWSYNIRDHNIVTFLPEQGNTAETNYIKSKPVAEAEKEYRENSELAKLSSIFGRNENDFYSSWYLLMNGLEKLNQSVSLPFSKLFLYGMQYTDLETGANPKTNILNDKITGNLNSFGSLASMPVIDVHYLPYDQQYTYDSTAAPGNYRIDVQAVPLGWIAANQSKYDDYAPYATGPIARYLAGDKRVKVIPYVGGRIPMLYILSHLYYPWFCFTSDQTVYSYVASTTDGQPVLKTEEIEIISNAAGIEIGRISPVTRGQTPTVVLESILLVDVTDKNKVLENNFIQFDVMELAMARPDLEPANLLPALHDGIVRFGGSWSTALDYMTRVYRSTGDMLNGLKQAVWLTCRYNRAGYVNSMHTNGELLRYTRSETMTFSIIQDGDYRLMCSNLHQFGDGTYIPVSDADNSWYQRESPSASGALLDCAPRFRLAVASGAIVSKLDVDDIGRLVRPNIGLAALDSTFVNLIYTIRLHMHVLHYIQSLIYSESGLALCTVSKMDRYNQSAFNAIRSTLVSWALQWKLEDDVDSTEVTKVLTTYNNSLYALYTMEELQWSPLLSIDKCILIEFGVTFPQVQTQLFDLVKQNNMKTMLHYTFGTSAILSDKMNDFNYQRLIHKYFGFRFGSVVRPKINIVKNALTLWTQADATFFGIQYTPLKLYRSFNYQTVATNEYDSIHTMYGRMNSKQVTLMVAKFTKGDHTTKWWLPYIQTDTEHVYDKWEVQNEGRSELYLVLSGNNSYGVESHFATTNGNANVQLPFNDVRTNKLQNTVNVLNSVFKKNTKTKF